MISKKKFQKEINGIIANAIREDVGDGDHSSLACIPEDATGTAKLLVKDEGIIAGIDFAKQVFDYVDNGLTVAVKIKDGTGARKMGGKDWRRREPSVCTVRYDYAERQPYRFLRKYY